MSVEDEAQEIAQPDSPALQDALRTRKRYPYEALARLRSLAEQGSTMGMVYVGRSYQDGIGADRDMAQAEAWYRRAAAAGNVVGYYALGRLLVKQRRFVEARAAFVSAAAKDYTPAMSHLGLMYLGGNGGGRDVARAERLLKDASTRGHLLGMLGLGILLIRAPLSAWDFLRGIFLVVRTYVEGVVVLLTEGSESERFK